LLEKILHQRHSMNRDENGAPSSKRQQLSNQISDLQAQCSLICERYERIDGLIYTALTVSSSSTAQHTYHEVYRLMIITTAALPVILVLSTWGMNLYVPFMSGGPFNVSDQKPSGDFYPTIDNLLPFFSLWAILCGLAIFMTLCAKRIK